MKRWLVLVAVLAGCAHTPQQPSELRALDATMASDAYRELERVAPSEMAAIRSDRAQAEEANKRGDSASAELYAERAMARWQRAKLLAERARTEARLREAEPRLARAEQELQELAHEQASRDTRIRELELQLKIAADSEPREPRSGAESAARKKARQEVAKSMAAEATLLCSAARLLRGNVGPTADLDEAERSIPKTDDFDAAVSARLRCLSLLESTRRGRAQRADALLEQISKMDRFVVKRDERGVVVTLPASPAAADLETLGRTARGRSLQVVVHEAVASSGNAAKTRGASVAKALVAAGADEAQLAVELAGASLPLADPNVPALRARNERIEIVYVQ